MVVGEDRPQCAVDAGIVDGRVGIPPLHRCLGAEGAEERVRHGGQSAPRAVGKTESTGRIDGIDALDHLLGSERAVLVVPAIARTIRRGHVELH